MYNAGKSANAVRLTLGLTVSETNQLLAQAASGGKLLPAKEHLMNKRASRLNLVLKTETRDAAIVPKRDAGQTVISLATEYGLSIHSIYARVRLWRQRHSGGKERPHVSASLENKKLRDAAIVAKRDAGQTVKSLATEHGLSIDMNYIILKRWRQRPSVSASLEYESPGPKPPPGRNAAIAAKFFAGAPCQSLANEYGITTNTIYRIVGRTRGLSQGLPCRK